MESGLAADRFTLLVAWPSRSNCPTNGWVLPASCNRPEYTPRSVNTKLKKPELSCRTLLVTSLTKNSPLYPPMTGANGFGTKLACNARFDGMANTSGLAVEVMPAVQLEKTK